MATATGSPELVRKFQPLWAKQRKIREQITTATTKEEKDKLYKALGAVITEINKGDWAK